MDNEQDFLFEISNSGSDFIPVDSDVRISATVKDHPTVHGISSQGYWPWIFDPIVGMEVSSWPVSTDTHPRWMAHNLTNRTLSEMNVRTLQDLVILDMGKFFHMPGIGDVISGSLNWRIHDLRTILSNTALISALSDPETAMSLALGSNGSRSHFDRQTLYGLTLPEWIHGRGVFGERNGTVRPLVPNLSQGNFRELLTAPTTVTAKYVEFPLIDLRVSEDVHIDTLIPVSAYRPLMQLRQSLHLPAATKLAFRNLVGLDKHTAPIISHGDQNRGFKYPYDPRMISTLPGLSWFNRSSDFHIAEADGTDRVLRLYRKE